MVRYVQADPAAEARHPLLCRPSPDPDEADAVHGRQPRASAEPKIGPAFTDEPFNFFNAVVAEGLYFVRRPSAGNEQKGIIVQPAVPDILRADHIKGESPGMEGLARHDAPQERLVPQKRGPAVPFRKIRS